MKDTLNITDNVIAEFLKGKKARVAKSRLYKYGERVTPTDTRRAEGSTEYLFVTSMRWEEYRSYGGYILFNPRTSKLISVTNIEKLPN